MNEKEIYNDIGDTLEDAVMAARAISGNDESLPENDLDDNIREYFACKVYKEAYEKKMAKLKDAILEDMGDEDEHSTPEGISAKVVTKESFKYVDETSMIRWLKDHGYSQFIIEKVNTTPMNKELKKGMALTEDLKPLYTKSISTTLTVERK